MKKVSDEKLLEMLLIHGGATGAASALGISRNAVYKRLSDPVFRAKYDSAQGVILSTAAASLAAALDDAIGCLLKVVNDNNVAVGLRVQAANSILTHCNRYIETANILRRIEELECAISA